MRIREITVRNFRGLQDINFRPDQAINVIVGPNAIGKSTLLEAIRLVKSTLSPRYSQETQQTLMSLGAMSPHFQFLGTSALDYASLACNVELPIQIILEINLNDDEVTRLRRLEPHLGIAYLRTRVGRPDDQGQFALTQYLSTEDGKRDLVEANRNSAEFLERLATTQLLKLDLNIDPRTASISGKDIYSQLAVSALDASLPPHRTMVSHFPADRAFPPGEINIQIGSADSGAQIQSHVGQSATKYARLKQTVVRELISQPSGEAALEQEFSLILGNLIPGKVLANISVNQIGLLRINMREILTGRLFDIDNMSSGEKGLLLTFLLIRNSIAKGGILLFDEPELHLHPAVCRNILSFLATHVIDALQISGFCMYTVSRHSR